MYKGKRVIHIVAAGLNGEIGCNNELLWRIRADLQFFKQSTLGHTVLMGSNTVNSLPKPLECRAVVKLSRKYTGEFSRYLCDLGILKHYLNKCVEISDMLNTDCIFVAGGASVYEQTLPYVDEVWMTHVLGSFPHADTFYKSPEGFETIFKSETEIALQADLANGNDLEYYFTKSMNIPY